MKNKHLVLIFVMLAIAIYFSRTQCGVKRERTFQQVLVQVDSASLSRVVFLPVGEPEFSLTKVNDQWILSDGLRSVPADPLKVSNLLRALERIETRQIATRKKEAWPEYAVDAQTGFRVKLYKGNKLWYDLVLGREDFDPVSQSVVAFMRLANEATVFVVDGYVTVQTGRNFDSYRNLQLFKMKREMEVTAFSWSLPDTTLEFKRTAQGWYLGQTSLDSMQVENYLNLFRNVSAESYADDFDELTADRYPRRVLTLKGKNIASPFVLTCYEDSLRKPPFILHASQNPSAFFSADSSQVFGQFFPDWSGFLPVR